jgi:hypothetical protein
MRYVSKKKMRMILPALAAAGFSAWMGVPSAHGDFIVTLSQPTLGTGANLGLEDFVVSAMNNNGPLGTGSTIEAADITVTTAGVGKVGAIFVDLNADIDNDGFNDADITGAQDAANGTPQPAFGSFTGSFIGIGGTVTKKGVTSVSPTVNLNIFVAAGNPAPYESSQDSAGTIDPNYTNGTVHSLEVASAVTTSPPLATTLSIPFANIVVPVGTSGTVTGSIGGDQGSVEAFSISFGASIAPPPPGVRAQLAGTALSGTTPVAASPITIGAGHGSYQPVTVSATGGASSLTVNGFTPGDTEIYGLDVSTTSVSLTQVIADLNTALLASGGVAGLPAGSAAGILTGAGDNVEITFAGGAPATGPSVFSYDLTPDSATVSSITVVPEPTGLGALVLGAVGLISRRKRRQMA